MSAVDLQQTPSAETFAAPTVIDGCDSSFWDGLTGHPFCSLFASRPWMEAVAATYKFSISASARIIHNKVAAAIMFSHICDIRGERIVSFPFSDFCDPLMTDVVEWRELVAPLLDRRVPVNLRCLRNGIPATDHRFQPIKQLAWHGTDLTRSEDALWAALPGAARTQIRKAPKRGLVVREGRSLDDVRKFYAMHCHVRKAKYRLLPQPFAFFEQLYSAFAPSGRLTVLLAEERGVPVSGIFFIEWGDTLYYKFNASLDQSAAANDLLIWEGIRMGQRRGLQLTDFGASDLDQPGLLRFKRKYATEERAIFWYRWEPQEYAPARFRQADHLLSNITQLLTDPAVPDTITRTAGDKLYGLFC
jgi:CelD/BcsL family acetyltransferase involved in cellulose biosynthesis